MLKTYKEIINEGRHCVYPPIVRGLRKFSAGNYDKKSSPYLVIFQIKDVYHVIDAQLIESEIYENEEIPAKVLPTLSNTLFDIEAISAGSSKNYKLILNICHFVTDNVMMLPSEQKQIALEYFREHIFGVKWIDINVSGYSHSECVSSNVSKTGNILVDLHKDGTRVFHSFLLGLFKANAI